MKFPIGIQSFERIIQEGYIYVDKTDIIYDLTHRGKGRIPYAADSRKVYKIGASFSSETGTISDWAVN